MSIEAMKQWLKALEDVNGMLERADCSTGYCCCGSPVDGHTIGDGHSPVDEGEYFQSKAITTGQEAITSLRQAIERAEKQEPFGYFQYSIRMDAWVQNRDSNKGVAFYTTPQLQREWVGLTDEQIDQGLLRSDYALQTAHAWRAGVVFAMTQLKEKNT